MSAPGLSADIDLYDHRLKGLTLQGTFPKCGCNEKMEPTWKPVGAWFDNFTIKSEN